MMRVFARVVRRQTSRSRPGDGPGRSQSQSIMVRLQAKLVALWHEIAGRKYWTALAPTPLCSWRLPWIVESAPTCHGSRGPHAHPWQTHGITRASLRRLGCLTSGRVCHPSSCRLDGDRPRGPSESLAWPAQRASAPHMPPGHLTIKLFFPSLLRSWTAGA